MAGQSHSTGAGIESCVLFIDWLFANYPFRKIYAESLDFNFEQFAKGDGRYFTVEGRLTNHELHNGRFCDNIIMAFERDHFRTNGSRLAARLRHTAFSTTMGTPGGSN